MGRAQRFSPTNERYDEAMLPKRELLHDFEWHDLPVEEVAITSQHLSVAVSPYAESAHVYRRVRLTLSDPDRLDIAVTGSLGRKDLLALEVSSFDILDESDDRLSGRLMILAGDGGVWTIHVSGATWQLVELAGGLTAAQRQLVAYLIWRTANDASETDRRWQRASDVARRYAASAGQLLLARDWTADLVLDHAGDVWIINTETAGQPQRATEPERRSALFRGLHVYPEIFPLLAPRPAEATTCVACDGAGIPPVVFANRQLQNLLCLYAGAGWTVESPQG